MKTGKSNESIYLKIISVTPDVVENCLEGSGTRNRKKSLKKGSVVHGKRNGGLDVSGDHTEGNI